ncbi:hypothetical protein R3I94_016692 [Phoxinus phoxinus]
MPRRKFKPCPSCQAPNQMSRKTCSSCFAAISQKSKLAAKKVTLDRKWGERILKNRNAGRVVDSAHIAVKKLSALGYIPILFFARKEKASRKLVADVVTHLPPTEDNQNIVATMRRAYNFVLIKEGNSMTTLPEPQPEAQHEAQPEPQHQAQPKPEPQPEAQYEAQYEAQPVPQHQAQPEPQPVKEQPPPKKRKCCQKCSSQNVFKYDSITGRRINEGQAEVRVKWLPCSACGKIWEATWEPACQFPPGANHV